MPGMNTALEVLEDRDHAETLDMDSVVEVIEDMVPGAQITLVVPDDKKEKKDETDWENDGDPRFAIRDLTRELERLPTHSGQTVVGCERVIAFLKRFLRKLSGAVQGDDLNVIDEEAAERLRDTALEYIAKLEDALDKINQKKSERFKRKASVRIGNEVIARINDGQDIQYFISVADGDDEDLLKVTLAEPTDEQVQLFSLGENSESITKEAGYAKVFLFEDPFLHAITRLLINSHVSAGRDITKVYSKLKDKYAFTDREELSIQELLLQKGFPLYKDLGRIGEDADPKDGNGIDFSTTYYA